MARKHFRESAQGLVRQRFERILPPQGARERGNGGGVRVNISPPRQKPVLGPVTEVRGRRKETLWPVVCPSCQRVLTWTSIRNAEAWCARCRRWCSVTPELNQREARDHADQR